MSATSFVNLATLIGDVLVLIGLVLSACGVISVVSVFNLVAVLVAASATEASIRLDRRARRRIAPEAQAAM